MCNYNFDALAVVQKWDGKSVLELIEGLAKADGFTTTFSFLHFLVQTHNERCGKVKITEDCPGGHPDSVPWSIKTLVVPDK